MRAEIEQLLDYLWVIYGNGYGTEMQELITELQKAMDRLEDETKY